MTKTALYRHYDADDLTLAMVRMRADGATVAQIARQLGLREQYVSTATNRVMRADMAESGEDVSGFYWQVAKRGAAS